MNIIRPLTSDGLVGYDEYGQLVLETRKEDYSSFAFIQDVRDKTCAICNRGWEATGPSMEDQMEWSLIKNFVHESCWVRFTSLTERQHFTNVLHDCQIRHRGLKPIENQYWPKVYRLAQKPWYEAELIAKPILLRLGSRKRVNSLEIVCQGGTKLENWKEVETAFAEEKVTKEFSSTGLLIHSYSNEDDLRYMKTFTELLKLDDK